MNRSNLLGRLRRALWARSSRIPLGDGARVAVVGGGPAGAFFSYFLLNMARQVNLTLSVDIYEPRNFFVTGPHGCNMCAGIISEALVQNLALEGIHLPPTIVQCGIDSYTLHMDVGNARLDAPRHNNRIAAVYRGAGPLGSSSDEWVTFDGYLLAQAVTQGANVIRGRVEGVQRDEAGRLRVKARGYEPQTYDLLAVAAGVKTSFLKLFQPVEPGYQPPATMQTFIREYRLGAATVARHFGPSFHVFLLDMPGLEFAALIPKGEYVTVCLLGDASDNLFENFLNMPEVKACMPPGWKPEQSSCHCSPRINVREAVQPFADRLVFLGDSGVSRLYKDGVGAAYRTAKAAAMTAVFDGVGAEDFRRRFWPLCRELATDNLVGKVIFAITSQIQHRRSARRALLAMTVDEQTKPDRQRRMSAVMWETFTGSAPYRAIFWRALDPRLWLPFLLRLAMSALRPRWGPAI